MAIRPSRTIQGLKTSAEFDRSAAANTQNVIKSKAQASGGKSRRGGGALASAATGALATRDIPMGDDQGPPMQDKQTPLRATAASPNYTPGSLMDVIAGNRTGETNPNFDSSKAIGGDNVPYKETSGVGGFFSRVFGNKANELNAAAQREQGAEWKADEREAKRLAREDEIEARRAAREDERFNKQQEIIDARRRGDREYQAMDNIFEQARRSDEKQQDIARAEKQRLQEQVTSDARYADAQNLQREKLALEKRQVEAMIEKNKPKPEIGYKSLGDGMFEEQATGKLFRYDPGMPGKEAGLFGGGRAERRAGLVPVNIPTAPPKASDGGVPVDPATGQPLMQQQPGGLTPPKSFGGLEMPQPSEQQATLADRFMGSGLGKVIFDEQKTMTPDRVERLSELENRRKKENEERIAEMLRASNQSYVDPAFSL